MSNDTYEIRCRGVLRGVQFGWDEYEGVRRPQLVGRFKILDGEDAGKYETWFASLSDDVSSKGRSFYEYTIDGLRTCGWTGDDLSELPAIVDGGACASEVSLVREFKLGNDGKWRSKGRGGNRVGAVKVDLKGNAMTDAEVLDFARKMKSKIGGNGGGQQQRSAAPPPNRTAPPPRRDAHPNAPGSSYGGGGPDDDIPFATADLAHEPSPIARALRRF